VKTTRRFRLIAVLVSLCALLFSQGALAGYFCPGGSKAAEIAEMAAAGLPCAESMAAAMDDGQPSLCHAHCQTSHQSPENYQPPALGSLLALGPVLSVNLVPPAPPGPDIQPQLLVRDAGPPLAIRNCCFRI
jgi:hypothetical protein